MALTDSLISYWSLDEVSGSRADAHGTNHLTDNNTVTSATGKVGTAADFVRANSEYLSVASNASIQVGDIDFTIAAWFKVDIAGAAYAIASQYGSTSATRSWVLRRAASNVMQFQVSSDGTATAAISDLATTISVGTWYFVVAWHDSVANTLNIQVNNGTPAATTHTTGVNTATGAFNLGTYDNGTNLYDGLIDEVGFWKRVLTSAERTDLYNAGSGRNYAYISSSGGPTYTLTADAGTFALTGQAANLLRSYPLAASTGTFTLAGQSANVLRAYLLTAEAASYAVTGSAANVLRGFALSAAAATFALTGTDTSLAAARTVSAEAGAFVHSGQDVTLQAARWLGVDAGVFDLTGGDAGLTYTALNSYSLVADAGTLALTGTDAALSLARLLPADSGAFVLTASDAALTYTPLGSYSLVAAVGSFTATGHDAALTVARTLPAETTAYTQTGTEVVLLYGRLLTGETGSYALTGQDAAFALAYALLAASGSFTLTGAPVTLSWSGETWEIVTATVYGPQTLAQLFGLADSGWMYGPQATAEVRGAAGSGWIAGPNATATIGEG